MNKTLCTPAGRTWLTALAALYLALGLVWLWVVPPLDGPDAGGHLRYIAWLQDNRRLPRLTPEEAARSHELVQQPPLYYAAAALLTPRAWLERAQVFIIENPYVAEGSAHRNTVVLPGTPRSALAALAIPRLLALSGGLLCVIAAWLLARASCPGRPGLALTAAALAALNPQFLSVSTAVSNDAWVAGASALAVWLAARAVSGQVKPLTAGLAAGAAAGAAALSKYSGLTCIIPMALFWLAALLRTPRPRQGSLWGAAAAMAAGWLLTAGWWFARNLALHGELVPLRALPAILPELARSEPLAAASMLRALAWLPRSYWAVFGYGILAPDALYYAYAALMLAGLAGCALLALRRGAGERIGGLLPMLAWLLAALASLLQWMHLVLYADQGRLLYSAAAGIALLAALGLGELARLARAGRFAPAAPVLLALLAASALPAISRAYALPAALQAPVQPGRPLDIRYAGGMHLVGLDLPDGAWLSSGGSLRVRLYLTCDQPIGAFYTAFLHLADEAGAAVAKLDGPTAGGRHPTRQWRPGEVFVDTYTITAGELAEGSARLTFGFYPAGQPAAGEGAQIALVRLHAGPPADKLPQALAGWQNGIRLYAASLEPDACGVPETITLDWGTAAALQRDYTVSVQWLDAGGQLIAQADQEPGMGMYPTSAWQPGRLVREVYRRADDAAGWERVIVLLYGRDGVRLPLDGGAETYTLAEK